MRSKTAAGKPAAKKIAVMVWDKVFYIEDVLKLAYTIEGRGTIIAVKVREEDVYLVWMQKH